MDKRILVIYDVRAWAYWRRAMGLQKFCPPNYIVDVAEYRSMNWPDLAKYDLVFLLEYTGALTLMSMMARHCPDAQLVVSHNSDSMRRRSLFDQNHKEADYVVCNNRDAFEYFERRERSCCISNGIDPDLFSVTTPIAERPHKVIWCGSSSKGKNYEGILRPLESRLESAGFEVDFRPIDGNGWDKTGEVKREVVYDDDTQRDWYNSASYVVCASDSEGTPNYLLEAAACGCVPVSTECGNILEFGRHEVNCLLVPQEMRAFLDAMEYARKNRERMSAAIVETMRPWSYVERAPYYFALFDALIAGRTPDPFLYSEKTPETI